MDDTPDQRASEMSDQLDEWLARRAEEIDNEPEDYSPADRMLGVCRYLDRERAVIEATYAARVAELAEWRDERFAIIDNRRTRLSDRLEGWARAMFERSGKRTRTWKLANGTLEIRAADDIVELGGNNAAAGEALHAAGWVHLTVTKHETTKTVIKDKIKAGTLAVGPEVSPSAVPAEHRTGYTAHQVVDTESGAVVPGVVVMRPDRERFNLRPALPARGSDHDPAADAGGLELPEVTQ